MDSLPVVMLAGGNKAKVKVCDLPMMDWVTRAFTNAGHPVTAMIGLCGHEYTDGGVVYLPDRGTLSGNLWSILEAYRDNERVIVTACDIPSVTPEGINFFLRQAELYPKAAIVIPVVEVGAHPGFARFHSTSIWVDRQRITMGNLAVIHPEAVLACREFVDRAILLRKDVFRLAKMIGGDLTKKLIWAQFRRGEGLTLSDIETVVSRLIGVGAKAILCADPGLGFDGDSPKKRAILGRILRDRPTR